MKHKTDFANVFTWKPIETAPENIDYICFVFWRNEDGEDMIDFDYKDDGCWMRWHDNAEHVQCIGGHGVGFTPPYTHWMKITSPR